MPEYYASPRVHDEELLPNLLAEMQRLRQNQDDMRSLVENLTKRPAAAASNGEAADFDPAEAAVGRAMLVAERHADAVRQAAEAAAEESKQVVDKALAEAQELEEAARTRREELEQEIAARAADAEAERTSLLGEAQTTAEQLKAQAKKEADSHLEATLQEAERVETEARAAVEAIRAKAEADGEAVIAEARRKAEEVGRAAEEAMQARLAELTDEISRTEIRLEALRDRKSTFERELAQRVRMLTDLLDPQGDSGVDTALATRMGGDAVAVRNNGTGAVAAAS